jgi:predicted regulator of Ras-like GTPase activity (Roadblock/LC7/MglB family)
MSASSLTATSSASHRPHVGVSGATSRECYEALRRLQEGVDGLTAAGIVGPDGFEVASIASTKFEITKVAALTSTLIAVADAFLQESGMTECRELILKSENGTGLLLSIPAGVATYGLFVAVRKDTPLGVVLYQTKFCVREVLAILGKWHGDTSIIQH